MSNAFVKIKKNNGGIGKEQISALGSVQSTSLSLHF